ncbi:histone acetyltransferase subunit NuA4-domain protein [Perilla frutescens var. hirtella]|uniref:Histone acetyltransferase subunit NuA4-domain protein n=1 Tax=Perilla frutescens var. hirtella TaxID=608512 RepID=A0AAD4IQL9_PERFH|nr:histone acetyltransferase subunit NuA4-domain protein [Perilla frutescens var. hirtella]KAH6770064.1 histone acetyltransferase subunit NuA4-domain protein [Perilla frutescens var. hirtella]KAH6809013.1 histone acetyltransferase subunit NuA4-domain protein [Perilla frutescens var. frutescens]KAH6816297.1 histone acetyltransferase subunit NuA4-domain protein [Perilla frutescens var. frutescens]
MELQGLRGFNNPKAMLSSLLNKREKLQDELRSVEKQVYELETSYLQETMTFGNALKGFDGFLSSSKSASNLKRSRKFQLEDRVFSLSSVTSPAAEELRVGKEDGKSDMVQGRPRVGGLATAGPGKPKKGRTGQREVKKIRISNDLDPDEDDDLDLR